MTHDTAHATHNRHPLVSPYTDVKAPSSALDRTGSSEFGVQSYEQKERFVLGIPVATVRS